MACPDFPRAPGFVAHPYAVARPSQEGWTGVRYAGLGNPPGARALTENQAQPEASACVVQGSQPLAGVWGRSPPGGRRYLLLLLWYWTGEQVGVKSLVRCSPLLCHLLCCRVPARHTGATCRSQRQALGQWCKPCSYLLRGDASYGVAVSGALLGVDQ